jgi:N-acetyl-anhydromuramyl-L-alanine amidase AmpD
MTLAGCIATFQNPNAQVSAHFAIGRDGTLVKFVETQDVAYHVLRADRYTPSWLDGVPSSANLGFSQVNAVTVGIELVGVAGESSGYTAQQYLVLSSLLKELSEQEKLPLFLPDGTFRRDLVVGHSELQSNKPDPGPFFSWELLILLMRARSWLEIVTKDRQVNFDQKIRFEAIAQALFDIVLPELEHLPIDPVSVRQLETDFAATRKLSERS